MSKNNIRWHLVVYVAFFCPPVVHRVNSDVFTSSKKVEKILSEENLLLPLLQEFIEDRYKELEQLSDFAQEKLQKRNHGVPHEKEDIKHPNGFYNAIQRLVADYSEQLGAHHDYFKKFAKKTLGGFAEQSDLEGAQLSLLRLQKLYSLQAIDMANGDYLGFKGPQLDIDDMVQIAQTAFNEQRWNASIEWCGAAYELANLRMTPFEGTDKADVLAFMGRAYRFIGDDTMADYLYNEAKSVDSSSLEVAQLRQERLDKSWTAHAVENENFHNFSQLCKVEEKINTPFVHKPRVICRYREAMLPYNRFKEEILAESPFVTVIYDVITDDQNSFIQNFATKQLERGEILDGSHSDGRISDVAWIYDDDDQKADEISQRVKAITGLEVQIREEEEGPSSSEPLQVVNYGLGGRYDVHIDQFPELELNQEDPRWLDGDRLATFLIYLTDVERGGATVFTRMGISVSPVKNMALLWYGYKPSMELDMLTEHAGCPVVIGQKWIVNKWILTYGNTFTRRCGLTPEATQLDIEKDMKNRYGVPHSFNFGK